MTFLLVSNIVAEPFYMAKNVFTLLSFQSQSYNHRTSLEVGEKYQCQIPILGLAGDLRTGLPAHPKKPRGA